MAGQNSTVDDMPEATRVYTSFTDSADAQSTVIIGAGIIGCATAYYLATSGNTRPDTIHLVEASPELFASASGRAAGFVAPDWFGPATASLGKLSFQLHKELAEEHDGGDKWGYSRSTGIGLTQGPPTTSSNGDDWLSTGQSRSQVASRVSQSTSASSPAWLTVRSGDQVEPLSAPGGVAQLDPLRLSHFLLQQSIFAGVRLHHPCTPLRLALDSNNTLSALRVRHATGGEHKIPCTRLIIAAGAWSARVYETLFPQSELKLPIESLAGHSLVLRNPDAKGGKGCEAVFTSLADGSFSPEIFSRVGGEVWIGGLNDAALPLPEVAMDANVDEKSIDELKKVAKSLLASDLEVVRESLCFRPVTPRGVPILDRVSDERLGGDLLTKGGCDGGVFVAAGHGPWGISLSLGSGLVMAEMVERTERSAEVGSLGL